MSKYSFENIPDEMRGYRQWIAWRYEDHGGLKPTKVPYCVSTGKKASVIEPDTWATYSDAVAAVENHDWYDGLGFVLTDDDPFAFIDLDYTTDQASLDRQVNIFNTFGGYAERSPSGKGLHIIVRAAIPCGRKRSSVEVYSSERYLTMTGEVYRAGNIEDCHDLLNVLWLQMGGAEASKRHHEGWPEPRETDAEVHQKALSAANGEKYRELYAGRWQQYYPSQSEADFALVDIIAFYTQNREQIKRMFQTSALGFRKKAKRVDYVNFMLDRCFDRILTGTIEGLENISNQIISKLRKQDKAKKDKPDNDSSNPYTAPPGLLGSLAHFIYSAAPRPVPEIALAGAIGLMAGVAGRAYNISGMGLNKYVLLLAPTGTGKEAIASGIDRVVSAVVRTVPSANEFLGPAEVSSPQALTKYLNTTSTSFVSIVGEFGLMLSQLSAEHAPPHMKGLKRMYLDLYNKSGDGKQMRPTIYSDREKNTQIVLAPAVSLLGESTPERFYDCLNESMITEGLLPRITVIEYNGDRPPLQAGHLTVQPSFGLIEQLGTLCAHALQLNSQNKVINVRMTPEAETQSLEFDEFCTKQINTADREIRRHLWNRAHVKVLKLAALVAVGINPYDPCIDKVCMDWAMGIVIADVKNLLSRFDAGEIGIDNNETRQMTRIVETIREYVTRPYSELEKYKSASIEMHANRIIPYSYLHKRLGQLKEFRTDRVGSTNAMKRAIGTLIERGDLQQVSKVDLKDKYGTHANCYMIANGRMFGL